MLQNADQRRDKDDRAEDVQEEEGQTFVVHVAKDKVGSLGSILQQMVKEACETFDEAQSRF